ncbi:hypothetical protein HNP84_004118 [Thermocatellispora tengchongensis]|uniref:Lantibiotic dehydratase N-terminal domain-containing protein n=1 Tax=Thermocatellispora tengchongensis TaxID=1073253 RepID=A0A840P726_9ACTN|nr:lantibiotic dehydratase [Thermocatellispora tengchongensis]MBB5134386.1 hypothetical protein [Thermocatellispora tengchongensis]
MSRQWRIGRVFVLRHCGMPFDWLEELAGPPALLEAADALLDLEESQAAAPPGVRAAMAACDPERVPPGRRGVPEVAEWCERAARYRAMYREADERATGELRRALRRPTVDEAIFMSNPGVYRNMLVPMLEEREPVPLDSRRRRARRQLYTYLQRFCAKSETVGFFGPMAYGTATAPGATAVLRTGLPRVRRVFLSGWAARELVRAIVRDSRMLLDLRFHRTGRAAEDGEHGEQGEQGERGEHGLLAAVGPEGATLRGLRAATGRPVREVAWELRELAAAGALDVALGGGPYDLWPLRTLAAQLAELPPSPAREEWLRRVAELDRLRGALETEPLAGKIKILDELERLFVTITGVEARRGAGATYADRAVVFEECSSPFALEVGEDLLREWERRLRPALEACVAHGHAAQTAASRRVAEALGGRGELPLPEYAARATGLFPASGGAFQAAHAPRYGDPAQGPRLAEEAAALRGDRYAVIDLCPRAGDVSGLAGAALLLARAHHHLQVPSWLGAMYPDPAGFAAEAAAWVAEQGGRLVGFDFGRRNKGYYRFPGPEVPLRPPSWTDAARPGLLRAEELTVRVERDRVRLFGPGGREVRAYLPLGDFVKYPPYAALSHPQVLHPVFAPGHGECEEVRIGGVAVQRARWRLDPAEVTQAAPEARFLALRRLARRTGRRFVFCRAERERKPYLIDLASPLAADLLGHVARGGGALTVEPMAPGPEELWLRDPEGRRYVCELRMQVIGRERP